MPTQIISICEHWAFNDWMVFGLPPNLLRNDTKLCIKTEMINQRRIFLQIEILTHPKNITNKIKIMKFFWISFIIEYISFGCMLSIWAYQFDTFFLCKNSHICYCIYVFVAYLCSSGRWWTWEIVFFSILPHFVIIQSFLR